MGLLGKRLGNVETVLEREGRRESWDAEAFVHLPFGSKFDIIILIRENMENIL